MAKPSFARLVITADRFPEFRAAIETACTEALVEAGELGVRAAKRREARHNKTGETNASIHFTLLGRKHVALHVGTLQGVFIEYGTKERRGPRGRVVADPYLRPAGALAAAALLGFIERRAAGIKAFMPSRGRIRTVYRGSGGRFAGSGPGFDRGTP